MKKRFKIVFETAPEIVASSPGRINIIGEHTDYHEGFVLPAAIDKRIYVGIKKRSDLKIRLYSQAFDEIFEVELQNIKAIRGKWTNYILGVVDQLLQHEHRLGGFDLYLEGDVPTGAGLSSSAAVECAVGFGLNALFDLGLSREEIAKVGQKAEHEYAGVMCGIMDQFASVLGKENSVIQLDCRSLQYRYFPLNLEEYTFLLLNTNVAHALGDSEYNDRRTLTEKAVHRLKKKHPYVHTLRDVSTQILEEEIRPFSEKVFAKCNYVVEENSRVLQACTALEEGSLDRLGELLYASHQGLSKAYKVSCPELDFLVDQAKHHPGKVLGARMMGGGFGGCTLNLLHKDFTDTFINKSADNYKKKFNIDLDPISVKIDEGSKIHAKF